MKKNINSLVCMVFLAATMLMPFSIYAQTGDEVFQKAVAEYQQSPSVDGAEKVIELAAAMDKLPQVPEEARKYFIRGAALFKEAKSPQDFTQVLDEFKQATRLAPWWPEARYNFALACESAGEYASAIANLKLYQLFKLPEIEARSVQDKIYVLEAKQEKAAKETSPEVAAAQERKNSEDLIKKISGWRYVYRYHGTIAMTGAPADFMNTFDVVGDTLVGGQGLASGQDWFKNGINYKIDGLKLRCYMDGQAVPQGDGVIAEDGSTINIGDSIYQRER